MWRPSAGSVYPTLQQLEDEGLATSAEADGKRVYTITDEGAAEAARRIEEAGGRAVGHPGADGVHPGPLFRSLGRLAMAAKQTVAAGSPAQLAAAVRRRRQRPQGALPHPRRRRRPAAATADTAQDSSPPATGPRTAGRSTARWTIGSVRAS